VHAPSFGRTVGGWAVDEVNSVSYSRGHPLRVPLWDYDGVAVDDPVDENSRNPHDFMRITNDPSVDVVADPNDDLRYVVAATVTMSWATSAAVLSEAMTVQHVTPRRRP
jgi:hypothetical protein